LEKNVAALCKKPPPTNGYMLHDEDNLYQSLCGWRVLTPEEKEKIAWATRCQSAAICVIIKPCL
jgi:hypothetical protein